MAECAIESVVETVRSATGSLTQNKKLVLSSDVAKSLPFRLGDEQRLTQVLLNLVGNAIKFTDAGEVRVTAKIINGHFNVSVSDTGPGIPKEHQALAQFHQVDSSNTNPLEGIFPYAGPTIGWREMLWIGILPTVANTIGTDFNPRNVRRSKTSRTGNNGKQAWAFVQRPQAKVGG